MSKKLNEDKAADNLVANLEHYWFNPALFANIIVNNNPLYTQDRLMELVKWVIKYQAKRFNDEWEHGQTSEGLMMASHLAEVIDAHENPDKHIDKEQ